MIDQTQPISYGAMIHSAAVRELCEYLIVFDCTAAIEYTLALGAKVVCTILYVR
jgi:hypothetical protein